MKLRTNEPTLWLAILLLALPTLTITTKIKHNNDSKDKTDDLNKNDKNNRARPSPNGSNFSLSGNFNKQTKNESYLNRGDYIQTNKENESILSSMYMAIDDKVSNIKDKNTSKIGHKDVSNIISAQSKDNISKSVTKQGISKDNKARDTLEITNLDFIDPDINQNTKINNNKNVEVDGKLESLLNKEIDSNNDDTSKEENRMKVNTVTENTNSETNETKVEPRETINAIDFGIKALEELVNVKEPHLYKLGLFLDKNHPAAKVATFGSPINEKAILMSRFGYATLEASKKIAQYYPKNVSRHSAGIPDELQSRIDIDACPLRGKPRCPPASRRFRTSDGTCNNLDHPWWGAAMLPMERFLNPVYEDGIQSVRRSVFGDPLPSARQVSTVIHRDRNKEIHSVTMMFTQWGQFIDHDVTSTVKARSFNGSIPRCCDDGGRKMLPPDLLHPSCLPIEVPKNDPFLNRFGIRCMEFLRSAPSTRIDCELGWREQMSQVTPYIDASMIYGSDVSTSDLIRTFRNGHIIYGRPQNQGPLNPPDPPEGELCNAGALSEDCLQPGDTRVSETPGLTAMHTVFVRYHNKVATVLSKINPHWSDERVYQESRRIVYSAIQHITYKEYLPVAVGPDMFGITDLGGHFEKYDKKMNPTIVNSFGAAAFRFGHSMIQNSIIRTDSHHVPLPNNVSLHEEIFNFNNIWTFGSVDRILLGFSNQPSQRRDEFIAEELTNHLFQFSDATPFGMDLAAINIQRGRDHGIAPYTAWRKPCLLLPVNDWIDLEDDMSINSIIRLKSLYRHVDDIDLFTGGLAEKPMMGGVVGQTFACIIASQFSNLRRGDRFFYDNEGFESSFTRAQLQQIKKVSLAQIICQTTDEVETIQPFVFLSADKVRNIRVSCDSSEIGTFDLAAWAEKSLESNGISDNLEPFGQERSQNDKLDLIRIRRVINRPNQKNKTTTSKAARDIKPVNTKLKKIYDFFQFTQKLPNRSPNLTGNRRNTRSTENRSTQSIDSLLKSERKAKKTTKKPSKRRQTTLKPFQITSVPMEVKYGQSSYIPNKPTFAGLNLAKPIKNKPQYYQIQDQTHDDVTYLLGILPKHTTKAPPSMSPIQVNINIHYSPHSTATPTPVSPTKKKKRPQITTNPKPPTSNYVLTGTHKPTNLHGQNHFVLITKRPATSTKRPATFHTSSVSYPEFIYNPSYENPNNNYEVTTKNPTYLVDSYFMATKNTKQPNINGYGRPTDVFYRPIGVKPSTGYYTDNYNDDDRYIPIDTKPSTTYQANSYADNVYSSGFDNEQYSNRPGVFESKPFSSSNRPFSVVTSGYNTERFSTKKPFSNYYSDNDNDSDVVIITNNKRRPQATEYNRDETHFNDHIFNAFFNRHDGNNNKGKGKNHGITKTKVNVNVDGKLDFKSRIVYKKTEESGVDKDRFVEISSRRKEEVFGKEDDINVDRTNDHNDKWRKKQRRSVNKIRIVDINVMPSESRNRWKYFNATEDPTPYIEEPEFPLNISYSRKVPRPMIF